MLQYIIAMVAIAAIAAITATNNSIYTLCVTQQTFVQMNIMCAFVFSQFWVDLLVFIIYLISFLSYL